MKDVYNSFDKFMIWKCGKIVTFSKRFAIIRKMFFFIESINDENKRKNTMKHWEDTF